MWTMFLVELEGNFLLLHNRVNLVPHWSFTVALPDIYLLIFEFCDAL